MANTIYSPRVDEDRMSARRLGTDYLLGIEDVAALLGCHKETASCVMKETGHEIRVHRRLYVLESDLISHLRGLEVQHA